jgi:hypothetical protein
MINLTPVIRDLQDELKRVEAAIAALEAVPYGAERQSRRGRKSMGEAERHEVSARMKAYWANRRTANAASVFEGHAG